jgi:hypothetical protein
MMLIYKRNLINFNTCTGLSNASSQIKPEKIHYLNFYKVMAVPTLLCGCETWALNRSDKRKIETAEIRFLRHVAGYTKRDEISNIIIRSELQIFNINDKIKDNKKEWHDHIQRMDRYRIVRRQLDVNPPDTEKSEAKREDGKMTFEDYYMIGADLMVYLDDNDDDVE